ncbi:sugar ABC transporter substrate-binding protein [Enterococcus sp. RIT-PI-f]|uniref:sugar ABC transporter substrate-binding protein n=1 Tax=Enterococcus sp. RIT-PI-f TaxID=1690244 RepID=UPI0006B9CF2D|nr:sugar ABC transporter substrate-binding protein [Enterococcus sp. RIT-PI-f]KPG69560.1 sugar ABC transporter substrate-binding protein [Enterococcus sp. RIT-PI-f]
MKNMKNMLFLTSSVMLLGACGGGEDSASQEAKDVDISDRYTLDENTPAWQLDNKEEVTELTWYVNADWWNDEWGNDVVTKQMEEDLNIKIKFIKGDDTNLNTMFSSNDMADIVTIFDSNSQVAQKADSWAYSLDDLSEKYDPYWQTVAAEDTLNWFQLDDGKTYGYPNYSNTAEDYDSGLIPANTNFLIRKDVYEAIGENNFETADDFIAGMKSISEKYPDLVPFGFNALGDGAGSLGDVFQDYLGVDLETEDGGFYNRNLDPEYVKWLKVLRQIHDDGNLSDDSFSDDGTAFEEKVKSGQYATIMASGTAQMSGFLQSWLSENPDGEYIAINGPQNSEGNEPKLNQSGITGWMINYISKSAKDPAKAMQIFTYLQSEYGGILTTFGIEGETFQYDSEGKIELLPEVQEMKDNDSDRFKKEYRLSEFIFFGHDKYQSMASESTQTPALIQPREWGEGKLYPHFILENIDPSSGTQEARNLSAINTNWYTTLVSLIRSSSEEDFDQILSSYTTFLDENGWSDIETIRNEKIAENKEKLGLD